MAGLMSEQPDSPEGKYLVMRRDGTIPPWFWFVLGSADPDAAEAMRYYASLAQERGRDPEYVASVLRRADKFDEWLASHPEGDPDAPRHRTDDPEVIAKMRTALAMGGGSS